MKKIYITIPIFILVSCITLLFQKYASIKGENINIIRNKNVNLGKLPDIIHDNTPDLSKYSNIADRIIKVYIILFCILIFNNNNKKYEIINNSLLIISIILFLRIIMFSSTILPSINTNCHIIKNKIYKKPFLSLVSDFVIQKYKIGYCNDYIFSGHNAIYILITLMILYYNLIPFISTSILIGLTIVYSIFTIICRNHYTIDIIISYFITYGIFTIYYNM